MKKALAIYKQFSAQPLLENKRKRYLFNKMYTEAILKGRTK